MARRPTWNFLLYRAHNAIVHNLSYDINLQLDTKMTPLYKYTIFHNDWFKDECHLIGKVKIKFQQNFQSRNEVQTIIELCVIFDGISTCNALSHADVCKLIERIDDYQLEIGITTVL